MLLVLGGTRDELGYCPCVKVPVTRANADSLQNGPWVCLVCVWAGAEPAGGQPGVCFNQLLFLKRRLNLFVGPGFTLGALFLSWTDIKISIIIDMSYESYVIYVTH